MSETIIGIGIFLDSTENTGTVQTGVFDDSASNSGTTTNASFSGSASNTGTVIEQASFTDTAINTGVVAVAEFTGSASNTGTVTEAASFADTTTNSGVVSGSATFSDSAENDGGTVAGPAVFADTAVNIGTIAGPVVFTGTAVNNGTVAEAIFLGSAQNSGTITGTATFAENAGNTATGLIQGDAVFADNTVNAGTVQGNAEIAPTANGTQGTVAGTVSEYIQPDGAFAYGYYSGGSKSAPASYATVVYQVGSFWYKYDASGNGALATGNYSDGTSWFTFANGVKGAAYTPPANWYDDSSASAHVVTFNGTQSSEGAVFDGTAQLTVPSSGDFAFGTGDFTVEGWIKQNNTSRQDWFVFGNSSNNANRIQFLFEGSSVGYFNNSSPVATNAYSLQSNTWYHVALSRSNNTSRVYVNGVKIAEGADNIDYAANDFRMGDQFDGGGAVNGMMVGVRVIKGVGLYTDASHSVAATLPTATNDTVLLLNFGAAGAPMLNGWNTNTNTYYINGQPTSLNSAGTGSVYYNNDEYGNPTMRADYVNGVEVYNGPNV